MQTIATELLTSFEIIPTLGKVVSHYEGVEILPPLFISLPQSLALVPCPNPVARLQSLSSVSAIDSCPLEVLIEVPIKVPHIR